MTVFSTVGSALVVEGFTSELDSEMGSGTNSTSRTAAAAANGEGYATKNVVAAAAADGEGYATEDVVAAAADFRGCATFNSASAAEIELALPVLLPKG